MRLLRRDSTGEFRLTEDLLDDAGIPPYAILSHTWEEGQEVTFDDLVNGNGKSKAGHKKIRLCGEQAEHDNLHYFWVDTCCIDKSNSVELQEAINSMFRWYQNAVQCYVYLSDVSVSERKAGTEYFQYTWEPTFCESRWFTRGWTLQELLAPSTIKFFSREGHYLGNKQTLKQQIYEITGIAISALSGTSLSNFNVEDRLLWAKFRQTTRKEDKAYSLLGIFGIYMPLIYGEGEENAFRRLREEIDKSVLHSLQHQMSASRSGRSGSSDTKAAAILSPQKIECLQSLSFPEQEQRFKRIETAKGTCQWLLEDRQYQSWMRNRCGLFWIKGNPGAGKSVLMKFAVEEMRKRQSGNLVLSFFIHGQGKDLQRTPLGIWRALLNSMLQYFPEHLSQLTELFEDREKRCGTYTANRWYWANSELQDLLSLVLTKGAKHQPVVIFIDALDECGEDTAKRLFAYFKNLMEEIEKEESYVKICFSSRHYPVIGIDTIPRIFVEKRNCRDIRTVVQERLKEVELDLGRDDIKEAILARAQGGFQWAVLVTALVIDKYHTGAKAQNLLDTTTYIPQDLDKLYTEILSGLSEAEERQMTKLFQWILFSQRPLSMQELRDALATHQDMTCATVAELRRHDSWIERLDQFERHVKHISRGLVEFQTRDVYEQYEPGGEGQDREALFIHQSVADYLEERYLKDVRRYGYASPSYIGAGHFQISRSCLKYLSMREVLEAIDLPRVTLLSRYPLVAYATRYLSEHIRKVEQEGTPQPDLLTLLQWDIHSESLGTMANLWNITDPHKVHTPIGWPFLEMTTLHVLVLLGSKSSLVSFLLENDVDINRQDSDGNTPLLLAVRECHTDIALFLLNHTKRSDINCHDEDGRTALSWAAEHGQDAVVSLLLTMDMVAIDATDMYGWTPLTRAVQNGREGVVNLLLGTGKVDVDYKDQDGLTPLFWAVGNEHETIVRLLLDSGEVDVDCKDQDRLTPLWWAVENEQEAIVKLLLDTGKVDVNYKHQDGLTPLFWAIQSGREAVVKSLLDVGEVDVDCKDEEGLTPLFWAVENWKVTMVKLLLDSGRVDVDCKHQDAFTPILWAAVQGQVEVVKLLLERGADIESKDSEYGQTPLLCAAENGHIAVVQLLLEKGAEIEPKDSEHGQPPLSSAAENGHIAVVQLLLEKGAEIESKDFDGQTPLSLAARAGSQAVVRILLEKNADIESKDSEYGQTPLSWAAESGHIEVVQLLLEKGAEIESKDFGGHTPLSSAARAGSEAVVRILLKKHADIESKDTEQGQTPLSWAAVAGHEAVIQLLLFEGGANIETTDSSGQTPLSWGARIGKEMMVQLLLDHGADIESKDSAGQTPLFWATKNGHRAVVQLLRECGADIESKDHYGWTPQLLAVAKGLVTVV